MRQTRTFGRFTSASNPIMIDEPSSVVLKALPFDASAHVLAANAPLVLDDPYTLWVVIAGEVDLFLVRGGSNGTSGSRRYVGTLWAGEVVAGTPQSGVLATDDTLVAVGFGGATVRPFPLSAVTNQSPDAAAIGRALANGLAETIGRSMYRVSRSAATAVEPAGELLTLAQGTSITCQTDVGWVSVNDGALALGGDVTVPAGLTHMPLARGAWLTVTTATALVGVDGTQAFVRSTNALETLAGAWALLLTWVARRSEAAEARDHERLVRKRERERQLNESALANLSGLLRTSSLPVAATGRDSLLDACHVVGRALDITFRAPPRWDERQRSDREDQVAAIASASRVRHRRVALRAAWWLNDSGPLLGYSLEQRSPVALLPESGGGYVVVNPVAGARTRVNAAVASTLDGFAHTFYRPAPPGPLTGRNMLKMLSLEVLPDARRLLALVIAGAVLGLSLPVVTGKMLNDVIPTAELSNAVILFLALVALAVGAAAFDLARTIAIIRIEAKSNAVLQAAIVDRLLSLPTEFFRRFTVGDLALRADAINTIRGMLTGAAVTTLLGGALAITSLALMAWYSLKLAALAIAVVAFAAVVTTAVSFYTLQQERKRVALQGGINALVFELLGGIAKIRVAAAQSRMFSLWSVGFRELRITSFRAGLGGAVMSAFNDMLPIIASAGLFLVATPLLLTPGGGLSTGDFVAFLAAYGAALASGTAVSNTLIALLNIVPAVERAAPILVATPEVDEVKADPGPITGRIELSHVSFSYGPDLPPVLDDVSFQIRPGEFVAVVGPSGSGKSTLLRLLLGFERPTRGAVYYDGQDLGSVDVSAIRRQTAVVLQQSRLLVGDIYTNIVGASALTHEDAWHAAELAGLADDIRGMPMGMHTVVSEGGSTLSGGQRQRLLIARALVRNPKVVFLDEATSALDNRSQEVVTRSMAALRASRMVIAHRLSTVQMADRIFVIEKGRVVQQGRFEDLMATDGLFQKLAARQLV